MRSILLHRLAVASNFSEHYSAAVECSGRSAGGALRMKPIAPATPAACPAGSAAASKDAWEGAWEGAAVAAKSALRLHFADCLHAHAKDAPT